MSFGSAIIIGKLHSMFEGCGYLFSDNRCAGEGLQEADVLACNHCQSLLVGKNWRDNGGWCGGCNMPVCAFCADQILKPPDQGGGCKPFMKEVEENLNKAYHTAQTKKILGIE